jgi:hypothetical protein
MTKRAQQFEVLAAGVMDSGSPIATGYVRFYEAGTTTLKNAYATRTRAAALPSWPWTPTAAGWPMAMAFIS